MNTIMKKISVILCLAILFASCAATPPANAGGKEIPIRSTAEKLGYTVSWSSTEKAIILEKGTLFIKLQNGKSTAWVNGHSEKLTAPISISKGVSYGDESLVALLSDPKLSAKYTLPVIGTEARLKKVLPYFGQDSPYRYNGMETAAPVDDSAEVKTKEHSTTNVQEEGIDEGDMTKTDGRYIYTIKGGSVVILDTKDDTLKKTSAISEENVWFYELYLEGNKLIAVGTKQEVSIQKESTDSRYFIMPWYEPKTIIQVYDLAKIEAPACIKTYILKGSALSSRLKNGSFYMALNENAFYGESPYPTMQIDSAKEVSFGPERIYYCPDTRPTGMMMTFAFDLSDLKAEPDAQVYLTSGETFYMSDTHLYIAQIQYPGYIPWAEGSTDVVVTTETQREKTLLTQFSLEKGRLVFNRSKAIEGQLLSQWSLDEYKGALRVAVNTSIGYVGDETTVSRIDIYSSELELLGKTEELAKGERIYAVRFMDDIAYLVTFKQIDPFFAIDCSDPKKPAVLGYLKIPGYSEYLHPLSATKILGIGHTTKENQFGGVQNDGLKFSVFDTTTMSAIRELDSLTLGKGGSSSESLYDHKAFMIHLKKHLFAVPVSIDLSDGTGYGYFEGAYILKYTGDYQLEILGTISHKSKEFGSSEPIRRILYIGDTLYTVSESKIGAYDIDTLKILSQLDF